MARHRGGGRPRPLHWTFVTLVLMIINASAKNKDLENRREDTFLRTLPPLIREKVKPSPPPTTTTALTTLSDGNQDLSPTPHSVRSLRHQKRAHNNQTKKTEKRAVTVPPGVKLTVLDNHKPFFNDCIMYHPTLKEEQPAGTYVFMITAIDPDPPEMGGTVSYKFLSSPGEKERFNLDSATGVVTTADMFDHDEPSREKEVYITVRASDNGHPQLDDACTIKINIEDINDNQPVFDKVSYFESMPQDLQKGHVVMRISATDIDDGVNSVVHYSLDENSIDREYFRIDKDNGVIYLEKAIDKPTGYKFKLSAIVKDSGEPPQQTSINLDINVIESNKKSPSFIEVPEMPIRLPENYNDFGTAIATVKATSNIKDETKLQFELVQGQTEQTNKWHTFVLVPEGDSAHIKLGSHMDFERITEYTLTVRIQNNYRLAAETIIHIIVEDVNDNIPVFSEVRTGAVLENEPAGTQVMQVQAFDADGTAPNNVVTYDLDDDTSDFTIDPKTGNITTLRNFDREEKSFYNIRVVAQDSADSALIPGKNNLGVQVFQIEIADKNDNSPRFTEETYVAESIAENANINELVVQVQAVDVDTASIVSYNIVSGNTDEAFAIRNVTGEIRVNKELDYEKISSYSLDVRAFDGLFQDYSKVIIKIENLNDNPPVFVANYSKTIEEERLYDGCIVKVEAYDPDIKDRSAPQNIAYALVKQDQMAYLSIDSHGCIRLLKPLDRDPPLGFGRWQVLVVAADQGGFLGSDSLRSTAEIILELTDINDNAPFLINPMPKLDDSTTTSPISMPANASSTSLAMPRTTEIPPHKLFAIENSNKTSDQIFLKILKSVSKKENAKNTSSSISKQPPPIFDETQPVVWYENTRPDKIVDLKAKDYDTPENGPPFTFTLNHTDDEDVRNGFEIMGDALYAKMTFDREYRKEYRIPIMITDSGTPRMSGISMLTVIIGDRNDNPMKPGDSSILVYSYKGEAPDTEIGRVYVEDPDDWDLPDKKFYWSPNFASKPPEFDVNMNTGMITMRERTPAGNYYLTFHVSEDNKNTIPLHNVTATVNVTIKTIPEEAVDKSGSIRFVNITAEEFIKIGPDGYNKRDNLHHFIGHILQLNYDQVDVFVAYTPLSNDDVQEIIITDSGKTMKEKINKELSKIINATVANVDVFTVTPKVTVKDEFLDVRFSAHGSPYYSAEKLNAMVEGAHDQIEKLLGTKIHMVNIDECIIEKEQCEDSCRNVLIKSNVPMAVYTNTSSFIGVSARVESECTCEARVPVVCLNGGTPVADKCECLPNFEGRFCELNSIGFRGNGWAMYAPPPACSEGHISLTITAHSDTGLVFYMGPLRKNELLGIQDFLSLELRDGFPVVYVNYGSGTSQLNNSVINVADGKPHLIEILMMKSSIEMFVDKCKLSSCMSLAAPVGRNEILNVNGPLWLGGTTVDLVKLGQDLEWRYTPTVKGLQGCITNFTYNDLNINVGDPSWSDKIDMGCSSGTFTAVSFGVDNNFLIAFIICFVILITLLLVVVVYRKKADPFSEKELDDIRENIIAYEDEGGGEGDAGYDLQVLRQMYDGAPPPDDTYMRSTTGLMGAAPDISGFLDDKKSVLDRDPDAMHYDDVRCYAYEGDGNTSGSLSSLASCTDDEDLKFNYLSTFGPRFRKLADMYGDTEEDRTPHEESWC